MAVDIFAINRDEKLLLIGGKGIAIQAWECPAGPEAFTLKKLECSKQALVRIALMANHTHEQVDRAVEALVGVFRKLEIIK